MSKSKNPQRKARARKSDNHKRNKAAIERIARRVVSDADDPRAPAEKKKNRETIERLNAHARRIAKDAESSIIPTPGTIDAVPPTTNKDGDLPACWRDAKDSVQRATEIIGKYVEEAQGVTDMHVGRERIRSQVMVWDGDSSGGCSDGDALLAIDDFCTPAEAAELCEEICLAIKRFRRNMHEADMQRLGCPSDAQVKPLTPRRAGSKLYVLALGDGDPQSDHEVIGQYGEHTHRIVVIHPDKLEQLDKELNAWIQSRPYIEDITDTLDFVQESV